METNSFSVVGATALGARERLNELAHRPDRDEARMAEIGSTGLFEEALLGALHAHLGELKIVAR